MATEKRARKKEHRDAVLAQREAALRRRRLARLLGVALVIALVVGAAVFAGGGVGGDDRAGGDDGDTPRCEAGDPPAADPDQYDEPAQVLEDGVDYRAVMETSCGRIEIDLLEDEAPITVNSFVFLAREGFYDGLTFHRIEPDFVIQGGDPEGNGTGGPGYEFEDELWAPPEEYVFGTLSMANSGPDTNGSQFFFIVHEPKDQPAGLPAAYTMFGRAEESSFDVLEAIKSVETFGPTPSDPAKASMPLEPVYIESVEIVEA